MMNRVILGASLVLAAAANAQPVQWRVEDGGNGHWYEYHASGFIDYTTKVSEARALGGDLASIGSVAENDLVAALSVAGGAPCRVAIGARRQCSSCPWMWGDTQPWDFTRWAPGEPSNDGHTHVEMFAGSGPVGYWADVADADTSCTGYVVEWSADCNDDGIVDKGQILSGHLPDANNNGIPDWSVNITRQPTTQGVGVDQPVFFVVEASSAVGCAEPLSYRWQRRNPQVLDDGAPDAWIDLQDGGGFLNASTASLTILRPTAGLATGYRCRLSGGCGCEGVANGIAYTNTVNFAAACPSDFNNDGAVDGDDVIEFFERWDSGC